MRSIEAPTFSARDRERVLRALGLSVGKAIDVARLNEGIRRARKDGLVESLWIRAERRSGGLVIVLEGAALRKLRSVKIEGVSSEVAEDIRARAALEEGQMASLSTIEMFRERAREALEARGYLSPQLVLELDEDEEKSETVLRATVEPGPRTLVGTVRVEGLPRTVRPKIDLLLPLRRGAPLDRRRVEASSTALSTVLRGEQYPAARVLETRVSLSPDRLRADVVFRVDPGDRLLFLFEGNHFLGEHALRSLLTPEALAQVDGPQLVATAIRERYQSLGFPFCTVEAKRQRDERAQRTFVTFKVTEGTRVRVDRLAFAGSDGVGTRLSESALAEKFNEGADPVLARGVFVEKAVEPATRALERRLRSEGYLSASVSTPRVSFTDDRRGVELQFDVSMGPETRLVRYDFRGVESIPQSRLQEAIGVKVGDPVDREQLRLGLRQVIEVYRNEGFLNASLRAEEEDDWLHLTRDRHEATMVVDVTEGPRYRIGRVHFEGLKKTKEKVVRREMLLREDEWASPKKLRESEDALAALGIFNVAEATLEEVPGEPPKKDVGVRVRESKSGLGEIGFGALYEDPRVRLRSFLGMSYRNLFGLNHTISGRSQVTLPVSRNRDLIPFIEHFTVIGYRAPYVFDLPFTFGAQLGADSFEINPEGPTLQTRARTELRLEKRFGRKLMVIYRLYRFEQTKTENLSTKERTEDTIGSTGPGFVVDFRDDTFNPRTGSFHTLDVELAHPDLLSESNIGFFMALSRNSFYIPLPRPFSFATFLGGGYARSLLSGQPIATARLASDLALGGQGSIRGFTVRRFSPTTEGPLPSYTAFYNFRAELTCKVAESVAVAAFADTGQIFPQRVVTRRHDGLGVGVRYTTPVGPISIDFAQGLGPDKEALKFYFTVGTL